MFNTASTPLAATPEAPTKPVIASRHVIASIPIAKNTGYLKVAMFELLGGMGQRECLEVQRSPRSVERYVKLYRASAAGERTRFVMRRGAEKGWTRIWRVQ
jgi:hypothetical protein